MNKTGRFFPLYPFGDQIIANHVRRFPFQKIAEKIIFGRAVGFVCADADLVQDGPKPPMWVIELLWKLAEMSKKNIYYSPLVDSRIFLVRCDDVKAERERYVATWHENPVIREARYVLSAQAAAVGFLGSGSSVIQNIYSYRRVSPSSPVNVKRFSIFENPVKAQAQELLYDRNPYYNPAAMLMLSKGFLGPKKEEALNADHV